MKADGDQATYFLWPFLERATAAIGLLIAAFPLLLDMAMAPSIDWGIVGRDALRVTLPICLFVALATWVSHHWFAREKKLQAMGILVLIIPLSAVLAWELTR